jgi:hypothetical protein
VLREHTYARAQPRWSACWRWSVPELGSFSSGSRSPRRGGTATRRTFARSCARSPPAATTSSSRARRAVVRGAPRPRPSRPGAAPRLRVARRAARAAGRSLADADLVVVGSYVPRESRRELCSARARGGAPSTTSTPRSRSRLERGAAST